MLQGALGYKDVKKAIRMHVDEEDKTKLEKLREDEMSPLLNMYEKAQVFINESGLYSLILKSKKEEAKGLQVKCCHRSDGQENM